MTNFIQMSLFSNFHLLISNCITDINLQLGIETGTITLSKVIKLGRALLRLLTVADIERLDRDAVEYVVRQMNNVYLCSPERIALASRYSSTV